MSQQTKEDAQHIKKFFETIKEGAQQSGEHAQRFDKDLSKKIRKVEEASQEVVKHIEEKK